MHKSQEVSSLNFSRNSCWRRCHSATQSTLFVTARRVSTIYGILLFMYVKYLC